MRLRAYQTIGMVVLVLVMGCRKQTGPTQLETKTEIDSWKTYVSPGGNVQFEYPSNLMITHRPRKDDRDPQVALFATNANESIQITLVLRLSEDNLPNWCNDLMDTGPDQNTRFVTERKSINLGSGKGYRQELREGEGADQFEYISVALEAKPVYVHFTSGYMMRKADLRPICERIVATLKIKR